MPSRRSGQAVVGAGGTVQQVLKNLTYLGDVVWGRRPHDRVERQELGTRDPDQWIVAHDAHPALISRDLFAQVQKRLRENKGGLRTRRVEYLLSGLVMCAQCGEPYMGAGGPIGPEGDEDRYRFYRDRGAERGVCTPPLGTMQRRIVEPWVIDTIAQVVRHPATMAHRRSLFDVALELAQAETLGNRIDYAAEKRRLVEERERLVRAIANGTLTEDEASPRLRAIRTELEALTSEAERARFGERRLSQFALSREDLMADALAFPEMMARATATERRELVAMWLDSAVMDKVNRKLTLTIRNAPALGLFSLLTGTPGRPGHQQRTQLVVTRSIALPQHIIRERRAR